MYAQITNDTITTIGRLPVSARRLDTGQWVMGLANAPTELVEACGWHPVIDTPPAYDPATHVLERGTVELTAGTPTVQYTVRAKTADELAADQRAIADDAEREQAKTAVTNLRAYIDTATPTNAQTVAAVKLLCRVAVRPIIDRYGK